MAVTRDAFTTNTGTGPSLTVAHTIGAGSDLAVIGLFAVDNTADEDPTATWNGVAMTLIGEVVGTASSQHVIAFVLVNPDTGAHNMVFSHANTGPANGGVAISYFGVDQVTPVDGLQTGSGSVTSLSETVTSATGDMVVDVAGVNANPTITLGGDGSQVANFVSGGAGGLTIVAGEAAGAASVTRSWSWTGAQRAGHVAFNINAAAGGGGGGDPIPVHRAGRGAGW